MVCSLQRATEVLSKRYVQILQLHSQTFVELVLALLRVKNGRLISVVPKMTSSDETITAYIRKLRGKGHGR